MAEKSRFFDSTEWEVQEYNADQFAEYFRRIIGNGVFYERRQLQPSAGLDGTSIRIDEGYAWINGYLYIIDEGGHSLYVQPTSSAIRVDRVVLRLDKRAGHGYIKAFVKQGTPGSSLPPTLTRNENVYELSLCIVRVGERITENNVIDEREDPDVCGFVTLGATEGGKPRPIQWVEPALGPNFTPATTYMPVGYGKDDIGFVHLRGVAMVKTHAQTAKLFELPSKFRPSQTITLGALTTSGNNQYTQCNIDIYPNGQAIVFGFGTNWISFEGISFYPDGD